MADEQYIPLSVLRSYSPHPDKLDLTGLTQEEITHGIKSSNLPDYIRYKQYLTDTNEALAQLAEMVIQFAVNLGLDPDQTMDWARKLQQALPQSEFDSWVATLLDGGPSIFMNTLSELQTTYPNGAAGVALVRETDPAKIYVWNGTAWQDFGDYQGIEIKNGAVDTAKVADKAITPGKTDFILTGKNLFDRNKVTQNKYWGLMGVYPDYYVELKDTSSVSSVPIFNVDPGATIHKNKEGGFYELSESLNVVTSHNMTTPSGAFSLSPETVYLAVNVKNEDIDTYQMEYGSSETSYELPNMKLDETISVSKKSIDTSLEKFNLNDFELAKSPMIFDKADNERGYINRNNGVVVDDNGNRASDYIKITSPTVIFSENIRGAINIAYYNNDFTNNRLSDQITELGTDLTLTLQQTDGYFRFSASLETMEDLIVEWGDTITTSSDIYYSYPKGLSLPNSKYADDPNRSTESISLILETTSATVSLDHVKYILERETVPFTDGDTYQNQDTWRIVDCTVNEESIVTRGAWECAIAIDGLPDFHGTYHGYELMDSINFYVDNKKVESGEHDGKSVRIVYKSKLIKQGTESVEIADVIRMYEFEEGKLILTQRYEWLESLPITNAYVTMLPIIRDGVTHTAYTDYDYVEYDVSTTAFQDITNKRPSIKEAWIYGDGVGAKVSVDYSDPSVPNTFFVSNAAEYNKFYYAYSVGREVVVGENWGVKTVYDIQ